MGVFYGEREIAQPVSQEFVQIIVAKKLSYQQAREALLIAQELMESMTYPSIHPMIQTQTSFIRKIELTFDKREHLETVTIDGLKVYDQMQQTFPCPKTTFFLKCCDWGREKILQITHDFENI